MALNSLKYVDIFCLLIQGWYYKSTSMTPLFYISKNHWHYTTVYLVQVQFISSPASQVIAERAGFFIALTVTLKQLADAGLDFPKDERRSIKVMMRKYGCAVIAA